MKKIFSMFMAFAVLFMFAACENDTPAGGDNPGTPDKPKGGQLPTPVLTVEDVTESGFTVVWDAVEYAESYTVVLKNDVQTITDTRIVYTGLSVGEYTVRVKAIAPKGTEWKDSSYATVSASVEGLTSVDWFEQTLSSGTDESNGYYPYNAVYVSWKGIGVESIQYGFFETSVYETMSYNDVMSKLKSFNNEYDVLSDINGEGLTIVFGGLSGGMSYTACTYVTNADGVEFLAVEEYTTDVAEASEAAKKWIGKWSVTSHETVTFDSEGKSSFAAGEQTFEVVISVSTSDPNEVFIDGFSTLGMGWPTRGIVDAEANALYIMNGYEVGTSEDGSMVYKWMAYCLIDGKEYMYFANDDIPSYILTMDNGGAVDCELFSAEATFGDGTTSLVEVVHTEIYGEGVGSSDIYFTSSTPVTFRSGVMDWVKM